MGRVRSLEKVKFGVLNPGHGRARTASWAPGLIADGQPNVPFPSLPITLLGLPPSHHFETHPTDMCR